MASNTSDFDTNAGDKQSTSITVAIVKLEAQESCIGSLHVCCTNFRVVPSTCHIRRSVRDEGRPTGKVMSSYVKLTLHC